ncbi:MAG: O-antigen ligase family protein [Patescibacteria group bacterium]
MIIELPILYLIIPLLLLAWLAWQRIPESLMLVAFLAPSYLIKSNLWIIPTTFLELAIYTVAVVCIIKFLFNKNKDDLRLDFYSKIKPLFWILVIWLAVAVLAAIVSPDKRLSLGVLKGWFIDPVIFLSLLLTAVKTPKDWLRIIIALWASASLISAYGLIEYGLGWGMQSDGLLNSLFQPANYVAMFIVPLLFLGVALIIASWPAPISYLNVFLLLINLLALFYTKSYGGFLALMAGVLAFTWFYLADHLSLRRKILSYIFIGITVAVLLVIPQPKFQKLISGSDRTSLSTRQEIWQTSIILIKEKPIFGWGLGNFQESYRSRVKQVTNKPLEWQVVKAHNLYLNLWIEMGLLGLLAFIYLVGKFLYLLFQQLKTSTAGRRLFVSALIAAMLSLLIHGLVDTPYFKNDLSLVFFILIGLGLLIKYYQDWDLIINYRIHS